jgi:hypothetical protein
MNKKITTIEDLAAMIEGEFRMTGKRFEKLEACVDKLESEIKNLRAELKADIAQLRKDFKDADTRTAVIAIELRVAALEKKVDLSPQKL